MGARLALRQARFVSLSLILAVTGALITATPPAGAGTDVDTTLAGREPVAAVVNPTDPSNVAVANFCNLALSTDYGQTFDTTVACPIPGNLAGQGYGRNADDVLTFDSQGNLYWTYLLPRDNDGDGNFETDPVNNDDLTLVVATIDPTNGSVVSAVDITPNNFVDDKPWIAADIYPQSPFADNVYVVWTRLDALAAGDPSRSRVMFSRTTDGGNTWSAPAGISAPGEGFVWPSHVAVAPNGDVYASYHTNTCGAAGTVQVLRDGVGGAGLQAGTIPAGAPATVQKTAAFTAGQADVTCNRQTQAGAIAQTQFWMQGSNAPYLLPDPVRAGQIYVVANDDPNNMFGDGDDGDIVMARSTDHGLTWSASTISHEVDNSLQVFPNAAIDQDGNIAVHWYDNRAGQTNTANNWLLDRYGSVSRDGGLTFTNGFRINDLSFDPDLGANCRFDCMSPTPTLRIGEYHGIWSVDGIAYATWTGNVGGGHRILFDLFSMHGAFGDRFEPNEASDAAVAAALGSDDTFNEGNLTLHSATDIDFFRVTALHTGQLTARIDFNELISELNVAVLDRFGNLLGDGALSELRVGSSIDRLSVPVVEGEDYFVAVSDPNAPNTFAPQSVYDLTVVNRRAPVPFGIDLLPASDSGRSDEDDLTKIDTPSIRVRVDDSSLLGSGIAFSPTDDSNLADDAPGFKVEVFDNGNSAGFATQVGGAPGAYELALPATADGVHEVSAKVVMIDGSDDPDTADTDHFVGRGAESEHSLSIRIDTVAPAAPSTPDLLASSDSAGISIDDITTITNPAFQGTAEVNLLVHVLAGGVVVGNATAGTDDSDGVPLDNIGAYEINTEHLDDGVYPITATAEDVAGNISAPSAALEVTIANQVLNLGGADADVLVNLSNRTVTGYPGIPGGVVGITGIPTVNLDANGHELDVLGTSGDDGLSYRPTGAETATLTRAGSSQVLTFAAVLGNIGINPLGGTDELSVAGTFQVDTITALADVVTTVQANSLKTVEVPAAELEQIAILARNGVDVIDITIFDSVNAYFTVDGGLPGTNPQQGDQLLVRAGSPKAKLIKQPGGGNSGLGSVLVSYPQTTGNESRIDYAGIESVKTFK